MNMRMLRFVPSIAAFVLAASCLTAAGNPRVVVLSGSDAAGKLSADRLNDCYQQLARDWKVDSNGLPNIMVFHVGKKSARAAAVTKTVEIRYNRTAALEEGYYEVWLVESPINGDIVAALESVLESHFHLKPTEEQRKQVMLRAIRIQNSTVDVYEGR